MSTDQFTLFADNVRRSADRIMSGTPYVADVSGDDLWTTYLGAFPPGTDPLFRERTEHDCSCCRGFIKQMGNVVAITPALTLETIWSGYDRLPEPYRTVAKALHDLVSQAAIRTVFFSKERKAGAEVTYEAADGGEIAWHHFHCEIPRARFAPIPRNKQGPIETNAGVIARTLAEINSTHIRTLLELIDNGLYRGAQNRDSVQALLDASIAYEALPSGSWQRERYVWSRVFDHRLLLRNSSIGTLLVSISEAVNLDDAVRVYERIVAPGNYQRSSAAISAMMVSKAQDTITELGLLDSLPRRLATEADLSVADVLFVNRSTAPKMRQTIDDILAGDIAAPRRRRPTATHGEIVPIQHLPQVLQERECRKLEVLFQPPLVSNLVTLTTAQNPEAPSLLAWGSPIAWSYRGGVTDSIKERVKRAGGNVTGWGRVSLSWHNTDDLDLHVLYFPANNSGRQEHIFYHDKRGELSKGELDVDMNVAKPVRNAVENVTWQKVMPDGDYRIAVVNFTRRERIDSGFEIEIEIDGQTRHLSMVESPRTSGATAKVAVMTIKGGEVTDFRVERGVSETSGPAVAEQWGLALDAYHEVNIITLSPNYWRGKASGNKHWMLLIDKCRTDETVPGFYNEFLRPDLREHRKVFEVLAGRMAIQPTAEQLSGLGFAETRDATIHLRTDGRPLTVIVDPKQAV
jgi:hypothetical protein